MLSGQAGKAFMTKTTKTDTGHEIVSPIEEEEVFPAKPVVNPCTVGVNASQTIPVGNYSNVKVGVHLSVTCEPSEIDEAFEAVSEWVGEKLSEMAQAVNEAYDGD